MPDLNTEALQIPVQAGLGMQQKKIEEQKLNQDAIQNAGQPVANAVNTGLQSAIDTVTITPQIAEGLKSVTGDDAWSRAVGTKWKTSVFTAITTAQAQAKYHNDLLGNKELLELMRDAARGRESKTSAESRTKSADITGKARVKAAEITAGSKSGSSGSKGSNKELNASKAVLHNAELRRKTLSDSLADPEAKGEAQNWLTKHKADIDKAESYQSSQVPAVEESSGTDKTIPLDQGTMDGLDPLGVRK